MADKKVDRVPKVNALILNRGRRNIGSRWRASMMAKATRKNTPTMSAPSTVRLVQPMSLPLAGSIP